MVGFGCSGSPRKPPEHPWLDFHRFLAGFMWLFGMCFGALGSFFKGLRQLNSSIAFKLLVITFLDGNCVENRLADVLKTLEICMFSGHFTFVRFLQSGSLSACFLTPLGMLLEYLGVFFSDVIGLGAMLEKYRFLQRQASVI